jgi:DNA-binding beta-propeller fold protein YncE
MTRRALATVAVATLAWGVAPAPAAARAAVPTPAARDTVVPPSSEYVVAVASEATDEIAIVRFGPGGASVQRRVPVGMNLMDPDGPHGLGASPDGAHYYVSTAHGTPWGWLWKLRASDDRVVGRVQLGNFPASLQVSPDGHYAFVVNFNLHGDMVPSDVSVVGTDDMVELARIRTCAMPHGSRLSPDGRRHWSVCMMDDQLVEIDATKLVAARHFVVTKGKEAGMTGPPMARTHAGHDMSGHGMATPTGADTTTCSPTWAQPSPDGRRVFVACNRTSDIVEIDVATWAMVRRIPAGAGVYNLGMTRDGTKLVATNKRDRSVSVIDAASGRELARLRTQRPVVHGVAISPDDRYAFVSVEGIGSEPGTLEVIDLRALQVVARVDVGQMAGGIDVLAQRAAAPAR